MASSILRANSPSNFAARENCEVARSLVPADASENIFAAVAPLTMT
jgi:hypothetical protein